jgi:hypothetical protein
MTSAPAIQRREDHDVAHQHAHGAKPAGWLGGAASADRAGRLDRMVLRHLHILTSFLVRHPAKQTAAAVVHQPGSPAAAVTISRSARALPPAHSSLGAPSPAEASRGASAFSFEIRRGVRVREAVAAVGSASVATADRDNMNATTLRVIAASLIAAKSSFVSARA